MLACNCTSIFIFLKICNLTDFKNLVRVHSICRTGFSAAKARQNLWADKLIVFAHWVCNFNNLRTVNQHIVDVVFFRTNIVENHFLISKTNHQSLCFAAELSKWKKAANSEVLWSAWLECSNIAANHNIFNDINFVEEVVAVRSRRESNFVTFNFNCASHACKSINNLRHIKIASKQLVYSAESCLSCRLEVVRNHDVLS